MLQAKTTEPIGRKVNRKQSLLIAEVPSVVVTNEILSNEMTAADQEAHNRLVDSIRGKYAFVPGGSEEFAREKQLEIEREDRSL